MKRLLVLISCWGCSTVCPAAAAEAQRWLHGPAISADGTRIVFTYRGDLWAVPAEGGEAARLTSSPAYESKAVWSPDGRTLAFASDRAGNLDVYAMPAGGGAPRRLTFHSSDDVPSAFSPDSRFIIFSGVRHDVALPLRYPSTRLRSTFRVPTEGGAAELVLPAPAEQASVSVHGNLWLYAERKGSEMELRKHERSPANWDLWIFDSAQQRHRRLTGFGWERREPRWDPDGDGIYYLSERGGTFNVWRMPLAGEAASVQLTHHDVHPVRSLSISGRGDVCYSHDGSVYVLRAGDKQPRAVRIAFPAAGLRTAVPADDAEHEITEFATVPAGDMLAFVARGEVFLGSTRGGDAARLTNTPALEANLDFSKDGALLAYASERDGHWQIYVANPGDSRSAGGGEPRERRLFASPQPNWLPRFSPDGRRLAYVENDGLAVWDVERRQSRTLLPRFSEFTRLHHGGYDVRWRADGRWLAFPMTDRRREGDRIGIVPVDGGEIRTVSHNAYDNKQPRWAPSGGWLAWLSNAEGLRDYRGNRTATHVFASALQPDAVPAVRALLTKDEEALAQWRGADMAPAPTPNAFVPVGPGAVVAQTLRLGPATNGVATEAFAIAPDGMTVLWIARLDGEFEVWRKRPGAPAQRVTSVRGGRLAQFELTADGRSALLLVDGAIHEVALQSATSRKIFEPRVVRVDESAERAAMVQHVGSYAERVFFDPTFDTQRWRRLIARYRMLARDAVTRREFVELLSEAVGELNASHTEAFEWPESRKTPEETAALGAVLRKTDDGQWQIAYVAAGSPLGSDTVGGTLLAIDGHELAAGDDWHRWLNGKAGRAIELTIAAPGSSGAASSHRVVALSQEENRELFYRAWVAERREQVRRLSGGRLAYSHLASMNDHAFRRFYNESLDAPEQADGLIVDIRHNEGGWLHETLLPFLQGRFLFTLERQGNRRSVHPQQAWTQASVMLVNAANYSNGYEVPRLYRTLGLGKLVGTPLAGTGLGGSETVLANAIRVSIANDVCRDEHGAYFEGAMLAPDILVEELPEDRAAGVDPQLAAAVKSLLEAPPRPVP